MGRRLFQSTMNLRGVIIWQYEDYLMQSGVTYSEQGAALIVNSVVKILTPEVMKPKKIWFHI